MAEVNDVYQARLVCTQTNQIGINVLHFKCVGKAGAGANDQAIADTINSRYDDLYKALLNINAAWHGVGVRRIRPTLGVETTSKLTTGFGLVGGELLPKQVSGLIKKRTATPGRSGRGRLYMPFPGEVSNDAEGRPVNAYQNSLILLAAEVGTGWIAGAGADTNTFDPVLFKRATNTTTLIIGATAKQQWATQRRRGDFGRVNEVPF